MTVSKPTISVSDGVFQRTIRKIAGQSRIPRLSKQIMPHKCHSVRKLRPEFSYLIFDKF